jgi:hypothetical protein
MLEVVRQRYLLLSSGHRHEVAGASVLRNVFLGDISKELNILNEEAEAYLNMVIAADNHDVTALIEMMGIDTESIGHLSGLDRQRQFVDWHNEMVLLPQAESLMIRSRMEQGMSYHEAKSKKIEADDLRRTMHTLISKKMFFFPRPDISPADEDDKKRSVLLIDIPEMLSNHSKGLSKTGLLKLLGKDNPSWRSDAEDVLTYLNTIQKVRLIGNTYYHIEDAPQIYETDIHRRVYEAVLSGKKSVSAIAKEISYDNSRGRKRVSIILEMLEQENLLQSNDNNTYQRWSITN